jgi:hypothetical protein
MASESGGPGIRRLQETFGHCHSVPLLSPFYPAPWFNVFHYKISNLAWLYRLVRTTLYKGILVNEILRETILHSTFLAARIAMRICDRLASLRLSEEGLPTREAISLFSSHVASFFTRNHALVLRHPSC